MVEVEYARRKGKSDTFVLDEMDRLIEKAQQERSETQNRDTDLFALDHKENITKGASSEQNEE